MLLKIAALANTADEKINAPEIKPNRPVRNIRPKIMSFRKLLILKFQKDCW
jgi:hypothetical protein